MSETPPLDGPRYGPTAGGTPTQLIMLLHGVGADGRDLIEMAPHLGQIFPNAAFVAPNAPNRYDQGLSGYQWISSNIRVEAEVIAAVQESVAILNAFIDKELQDHGIGPNKLALVGFSQGTMMSLYVAPRRDAAFAAVVGYSGRLLAPQLLASEAVSKPPVMLIHGEMDDLVPFESMAEAEAGLTAVAFSVETLACPGLGHGIDPSGLQRGGAFLKAAFAG